VAHHKGLPEVLAGNSRYLANSPRLAYVKEPVDGTAVEEGSWLFLAISRICETCCSQKGCREFPRFLTTPYQGTIVP